METTSGTERPWAKGIGLLLLGLAVSAVANLLGQQGEPGGPIRALGFLGYSGGLVIAGSGIHRILWAGPTARSRQARLFITVIVTIPAFVAMAILLSVILTITQQRFSS